nr:hypothetical protein [Nocardioides ungokensis]
MTSTPTAKPVAVEVLSRSSGVSTATRTPCWVRTPRGGCHRARPAAPGLPGHGRYDGQVAELGHEHEGIWVGVLPVAEVPDYRVSVAYDGEPVETDDPYRFLPTLGEIDLHLINEGRHEQLWDVLGAHVHHYRTPLGETISGTAFAVWAPSARGVRLKASSFNSWDGREHPMRQLGTSVSGSSSSRVSAAARATSS